MPPQPVGVDVLQSAGVVLSDQISVLEADSVSNTGCECVWNTNDVLLYNLKVIFTKSGLDLSETFDNFNNMRDCIFIWLSCQWRLNIKVQSSLMSFECEWAQGCNAGLQWKRLSCY